MPITLNDPRLYILLFGVLIVILTTVIFKISQASLTGLVASFLISVILTGLAFYMSHPEYGQSLMFYFVVGIVSFGVMYFGKTWSGFASSVLVGIITLSMYMYATNPRYGLTIIIVAIVAVVLIGVLAVIAYGMNRGYGVKKADSVKLQLPDPRTGRMITMTVTKGAFSGPTLDRQLEQSSNIAGLVKEAQFLFEDPRARAKYLAANNAGYSEAAPYVDAETGDALLQLEPGRYRNQ